MPVVNSQPTNQYYVIQTSLSYSGSAIGNARKFKSSHEEWVEEAEREGVLFLGGDFCEGDQQEVEENQDLLPGRLSLDDCIIDSHRSSSGDSAISGSPSSDHVPDCMYVIRCSCLKEAENFAQEDPYNMNCVTTYRVVPWKVGRGRVGVEVRMGGGEFRIE